MPSMLDQRIQKLNQLPRPPTDSKAARNYYHFLVKTLPSTHPGDLIFCGNPYNGDRMGEGRTEIIGLAYEDQVKVIVPLLMEMFTERFNGEDKDPFAPYTWSTYNENLARAVSARLRALNVRSDLCEVQISTAFEYREVEYYWTQFSMQFRIMAPCFPDDLVEEVGSRCAIFRFTPSLDTSLMVCGRCKETYYCSKPCQKSGLEEPQG
jgi:hypothetical protein